ncbi:protein DCL, chloroplastic-like [Iris pallida]|uniref:Protein DCL, chloroplastic-like n=1 Tax=Iris pallida TaxID=29817 RepID=A0AAX6E5T9_IRIPA|nr:protein DCL, chloroplastic-like [Iris pallida]
MAEVAASKNSHSIPDSMETASEPATDPTVPEPLTSTNKAEKREREEEGRDEEASKKAKVEEKDEEEKEVAVSEKLGPKSFGSGEEMFNYFFKFLHFWPPNVNVNKYEHMVLFDLLKKGHAEANKKIGAGIQAFQVRFHPTFKSRCFFIVRTDGTSEDFSFRKCVEHLLPLPENMKRHHPSSDETKAFNGKNSGGHQKRGGVGRGGGRGRGQGRRGGGK